MVAATAAAVLTIAFGAGQFNNASAVGGGVTGATTVGVIGVAYVHWRDAWQRIQRRR